MSRLSPNILTGLFITLFCGLSFLIRTLLPFDKIFSGGWIKFSSIDAYYHMYLVDNMARNFPHLTSFSPYFIYPDGGTIAGIHFFDWLLGGICWVVGLGSPTQHTVDVVSVYFPAILGALTVIPVFFIGKVLFNKWVGIIAAVLIAILPGEFLGRSILGFTDQHIAEVLFSLVAVLFLILAIKQAQKNDLTFSSVRQSDWKTMGRPLVYMVLAGLFLGIYLITWQGGLLFVFIIALYFVIQFIIDHLRRKSTAYLSITGFVTFLIAAVIFLRFSPSLDISLAIVAALLIPPVLGVISWLMRNRNLKPLYFPAVLVLIGVVILVIVWLAAPGLFDTVKERFTIFNPGGASAETTIEMQSFFTQDGGFYTGRAWGNFTTGFFLTRDFAIPGFGIIGFFVLLWLYIRRRGEDNHWLLLVIWTLVVLVATIGQRRFAYYLAINVALLTAFIAWQIMWLVGLKNLVKSPEPEVPASTDTGGKNKKVNQRDIPYGRSLSIVSVAVVTIVVFFLVFFWNIQKSVDVAKGVYYAPSDGWQESLLWMKDNTPEPFGDPEAYYGLYENPPPGESFEYPESAYGVTSWWDYGYWITRTAQRIPNANPSQATGPIENVAAYLLSTDIPNDQEIQDILLDFNTKYVAIDFEMTLAKFPAIANWADEPYEKYFEIYLIPYSGQLTAKIIYYPEYYQTTCVRLYHFNGEAFTDEKPVVIEYEEAGGYKRITRISTFSSYEEALDYLQTEGTENRRIVGLYPFISPIPLEKMEDYRLVHTSEQRVEHLDWKLVPEVSPVSFLLPDVKIFEYTGD
jgi:oligosaccharyl transferase (archaeosortase A-associated)